MEETIIIEYRPGTNREINDIFFEKKPSLENGKKYKASIKRNDNLIDFPINEEIIEIAPGGYRIVWDNENPTMKKIFSEVQFGEIGFMKVKRIKE